MAVSVLALTSFGACQKYDDSELRNLITDLQNENSDLRGQITDLKSAESGINSDIKALNQLVSTLETSNYITSVTALPDGSGYTIAFASGEPVTVHNGVKGEDGLTPKISVGLYEGAYYWTLDGEWLTDDSGNKMRVTGEKGDTGATGAKGDKGDKGDKGEKGDKGATGDSGAAIEAIAPQVRINTDTNEWEISTDGGNTWVSTGVNATGDKGDKGAAGKDGVTPQFKIVDGNWMVSYDNGASWSEAGSATASSGIVGATVDETTHTLTLTLADGTKIPITYNSGKSSSTTNPKDGKMETVLIKAGTFTMGSPETETGHKSDETQHQVTLTQDFYMGKYEVTNAQFAEFLNSRSIGSGGSNSSYNWTPLIYTHSWGVKYNDGQWIPQSGYDDYPVVNVTWYGADGYAKWIGGSLPTEAQWEYACRAGSTTAYCFGDSSDNLGDYAWSWSIGNISSKTHPVGQKKPNAWGLYDMHGNAAEWCADCYNDYPTGAVKNPFGTNSSYYVLRGGSWGSSAGGCRSANRSYGDPGSDHSSNVGFRVCFPL